MCLLFWLNFSPSFLPSISCFPLSLSLSLSFPPLKRSLQASYPRHILSGEAPSSKAYSSGWRLFSPLLRCLPLHLHGGKSPLKDLIEAQRSRLHWSFTSKLPSLPNFCTHFYWGNPILFGIWDGSYAPFWGGDSFFENSSRVRIGRSRMGPGTFWLVKCYWGKLAAISHGRLYQSRMKSAFEKNVRLCEFTEGDLILKKISHVQKDHWGKWALNYEGPFMVKKAFSGGALLLMNMDDEELPLPVNSDVVKWYYAWYWGQFEGSLFGPPQGFIRIFMF